jgi:hypothetical protein
VAEKLVAEADFVTVVVQELGWKSYLGYAVEPRASVSDELVATEPSDLFSFMISFELWTAT